MKIRELNLFVPNLEVIKNFYNNKLEFNLIDNIKFKVGETILVFNQQDNILTNYHFAFNIPCNQILEAKKWLENKNIEILNKEIYKFNNWNADSIYFKDCNNNIIEFIARYDLENYSTKLFNSYSLESISEIGVVTDNAFENANFINQINKASYYKSTPTNEDNFCPIGNEEGLLIFVNKDKYWFPTEIKAMKSKLKLEIELDNKIIKLEYN